METKKTEPKKLSTTNTKQEMLEAYNLVVKQLREKEEAELKPEKRIEERKASDALKTAESVVTDGVAAQIGSLKTEIGRMLSQVSDKLESETDKLAKVQQAVVIREKELQELYAIEREAQTLAALIEAQTKKREDFESRMASDKEALGKEIELTRSAWDQERKSREAESREWEAAEKKKRDREKEEYDYAFKREQRLAKDAFQDEKDRIAKAAEMQKTEMEAALGAREKAVAERERVVADLEQKVNGFPGELESAVKKAVQDVTNRLAGESKNREELLKKEFDGERKVFTTRIDALEKTVKEQHEQVGRLSQQLEKSYEKVEDIAVKAVQSASAIQSGSFQQMVNEQARKQGQEK